MSNEENVYVEPPIEVTVSEGAMGVLNISTNNHNDLANRDGTDQHKIDAITGLRAKLLEIQNPTVAKSVNGRGYAEYYKWLGGAPSTDKTGYFVSLVQDEDGNLCITPVSATYPNIFGVTISRSSAAFVGNDDWTEKEDATGYESSIDESYGLVCLEGAVKVRYAPPTLDIKPGDWVRPTSDGRAEKASSTNGCYIVAGVGVDTAGHYVEINLSLSASDVKKITVDHAMLSDNASNYTANGTIKKKFDEITYEFDDIKDGTTVVGEASHSVSTDDYTENGTIKAKFDEVNSYVSDIEDGVRPVSKAIRDNNDYQIDRSYYHLYPIDKNSARFISKDKPINPITNLNELYKPSQCGIYVIEWGMVQDGLISGLPEDNVFPTDGATIKLIVEADYNDNEFPTVWHTLKVRGTESKHNDHLIMYHRVCTGTTGDEPVWSDWQRFVSASELENGKITVRNAESATNATNDQYGISIADNYYCFDGHNISSIESGNLDDYTEPGSYYIPYVSLRDEVVVGTPRTYTNIGEDARLTVECYDGHVFQRIRFMTEYEGRGLEFTRVKALGYGESSFGEWSRYVTEDEIKNMATTSDIEKHASIINYSYDTTTKAWSFPIGAVLTFGRQTDTGAYNIGTILAGDMLWYSQYGATYVELMPDSPYTTGLMPGRWMILGMCGTTTNSNDKTVYLHLIQRIE